MDRTWHFCAAVAVALGVAYGGVRAGEAVEERQLAREQAEEILRAHNAWRRKVGVLSLRWVADLAHRAQARAARLASDNCSMEHGLLPEDVGENLFRAWPLRAEGREDEMNPVTPTQVVDAWGAEESDYDYGSNRCARGKQCAHYTQLIWATSEEVGCGMAVCASRGQVWVCNYRPTGNIQGHRPY
jgi:pathogenesis-related protein 1